MSGVMLSLKPGMAAFTVFVWLLGWINGPASTSRIEEWCTEKDTHCKPENCADRIPGPVLWFGPTEPLVRSNCRCDRRCSLYGDCCVDYWDQCVNDTDPPITTSEYAAFFECVTPSIGSDASWDSYTVVGRCPPDWPRDTTRQRCENDTLAQTEKFLTFPVNGPDQIIFKNVFCTFCHRVPAISLKPWSLTLWDCAGKDYGTPNFNSCLYFKLTPPLSMSADPHLCYHNFVDDCPANATDAQKAYCGNYTSIVFDPNGVTYKNIYCKECSNPSVNLMCRNFGWNRLDPVHSFTLLFNFTARSVLLEADGSPEVLGACGPSQIFDPFQGVCRNLSCPVGTRLQTGRCVRSWDRSMGSRIQSLQTSRMQSLQTNGTAECLQDLLSSDTFDLNPTANFTTLAEFSLGSKYSVPDNQIYVHSDLSISTHLRDALDRFASDWSLSNGALYSCNATTLLLVSLSRSDTNRSSWSICEGFTVHDIQLEEIVEQNDGSYVADGGYMYKGRGFMHVTQYNLGAGDDSSHTSRKEYLRLCSPFAGSSCPVVSFDKGEFLLQRSGPDAVFVHRASGTVVPAHEVWQLPDGTLRMCSFLSQAATTGHPAWLTMLSDLSFAGSVCSLVTLLLALVTYSLHPTLRSQPGKIIMNLMVALILAQSVLMIGRISTRWLCVLRAIALHFAWLSAFAWMIVLAGDLVHRFKSNERPCQLGDAKDYKVLKLGLLAWGLPAIFVSVCYLVSSVGRDRAWLAYGGSNCWIEGPMHSLFVFGVPVAVLLSVNCALVAFMIYRVTVNRRRLAAVRMARNAKRELLLCLKLILVTGVTWSLLFVANAVDTVAFWYAAVLINSLQGALVGLMFLLKGNVRSLWRERLRQCRGVGGKARPPARNRVEVMTVSEGPETRQSGRIRTTRSKIGSSPTRMGRRERARQTDIQPAWQHTDRD